MARTLEIVRQWKLLQALDGARHGLTLRRMAEIGECSERTIRRDLEALQKAGFPLYDEKVDGSPRWRLDHNPLKALDPGFRLTELCALYFSRAMLEALAGSPFTSDVKSAFARFEKALLPRMKKFLDQLPGVVKAKPAKMTMMGGADPRGERTARLLDATLNQREVQMRYASASSGRTKEYRVHPYRIAYAEGGLYLIAFVPEYQENRTFALQRIKSAALLDTRFERREPLSPDVFPHSLGVNSGAPERIVVEFDSTAAAFVRERQWHPSQRVRDTRDGRLRMELRVCRDAALRSWLLSFGASARVVEPQALADEISAALHAAREQYQRIAGERAPAPAGPVQRALPFPREIKEVGRAS